MPSPIADIRTLPTAMSPVVRTDRGLRISHETLARAGVFLAMALSGFVFSEPAPVDLVFSALLVLLPLLGVQRFAPAMIFAFLIWLGCGVGGLLASGASREIGDSTTHTAISFYLYTATLVLAAFIAYRPVEHTRLVFNAWVLAACIAAAAALAGYFQLFPGAFDLFTRFGRATGTFKDPNVLGPFLVPPALYLIHRIIHRQSRFVVLDLAGTGLIVIAILLSFSRGAWFSFGVALAIYLTLTLATLASSRDRARLVGIGATGAVLASFAFVAVLQVPAVATLLAERSHLTQSYDVGPEGRFGGQEKATQLIIDNPFGIGAKQFSLHYHHEDVHNVYLSMFLNAGWLGGILYVAAVIVTLAIGYSGVLHAFAARPYLLVAVAAFTGNVLEGFIIDTDHWRHFYFLMAIIWGLAAQLRGPVTDA
ncbi:MAG: O-antigen ligase family protein [Proteobacteria bacterium]|nr:O-antigen ligase family protein [Pseudomonadota bacterium]